MCLAERSFLRPGGPPYSADPPSNNAKSMRFGPFGVRIDCHAPAPEGEWGQICGTFTAVGRPKTPNTVLQTRRAQKRFNLASVRLSKMGKHHSFSYGFLYIFGKLWEHAHGAPTTKLGATFWAFGQRLAPILPFKIL